MGTVVKIVLRLRQPVGTGVFAPFGRDMSFVHLGRAPVPTWWVPRPLSVPALIGWVAGPSAQRFAAAFGAAPVAVRARAALAGLARGLGVRTGALLAAVEDVQVVDWAADPFARGAYSWLPVGGISAPAALASAVAGRLFFAGEATDTAGDGGTVHGALATGARAADEIQAALRRVRLIR
jgi:monoamine oxidase